MYHSVSVHYLLSFLYLGYIPHSYCFSTMMEAQTIDRKLQAEELCNALLYIHTLEVVKGQTNSRHFLSILL
jgi:hypothetical protein